MSLRLTVLLGPSATVEAAELRMGVLPGVLAMAVPFESWHEVQGSNILAETLGKVADAFLAGMKKGEHLKAPPVAEPEPPHEMVETAPAVPRSTAEPTEYDDPLHPSAILVRKVMRELVGADDFDAWLRVEEARNTARRIVALVERRRE